ncbi:MAG: hypothetical protein ACXWKY_14545 [Caulobacteraceae bacterium]
MGLASSSAAARLGHIDSVSPIAGRLDAARRAVEGRFVAAGDVLARSVDGVGRLIASLDSLGEVLDAGAIRATTAELKVAAASLAALPQRHGDRRRIVEQMIGLAEELRRCVDEMRRHMGYLWVFAINIKISAAGVSEAGPEFGLFAQEICDRIEQGRNQLGGFDAELKVLSGELAAAQGEEAALAGRCDVLLPAVPDGLVSGADALSAQHGRVASAAREVAGLARQIHRKVGTVLGALQIGDITRQRIEHVQAALALIEETRGLTPEQDRRLRALVHHLLAAQLEATSADFHRDVARIGQNMSEMAAVAGELLRLRDLAFDRDEEGQGFLQRMEGHVSQARGLVGEMEAADHAATAVASSAAAAATALNTRIASLQAIKTDVQQMALNTMLKCGRIGDSGKPLAVIAMELRLYATQLDQSAQTAMGTLGDLTREAGAMVGAPREEGSAGQALAEVSASLREAADGVAVDLRVLADLGASVVGDLKKASASLDFQIEIGSALDDAARALADWAGPEVPLVEGLEAVFDDISDSIAKSYTMAQERNVHRAFVEQVRPAKAASPSAAQTAGTELDGVLF